MDLKSSKQVLPNNIPLIAPPPLLVPHNSSSYRVAPLTNNALNGGIARGNKSFPARTAPTDSNLGLGIAREVKDSRFCCVALDTPFFRESCATPGQKLSGIDPNASCIKACMNHKPRYVSSLLLFHSIPAPSLLSSIFSHFW
jgi:hypothetical protein